MEDVIEHLIGREIYEESDVAVDMRELARRKARKWAAAPDARNDSGNADKSRP